MTHPGRFKLGDLDVARVGYGSMKLTGWPDATPYPDRDAAHAVLRRAVELGVDHIDTSFYYDHEGVRATDLIREALHPYPANLRIVTKVGPRMVGGEDPSDGLAAGNLRRAVEWNLESLGLEVLDAVNLRVDGVNPLPGGTLEQPLTELRELQEEGLIRHIGISNVPFERFQQAREFAEIACVQNFYNLAVRKSDPIIDVCEAEGIAFVPFFPVSQFTEEVLARVGAVAARHDATVQQIALAWLLHRSPNILLIPGTGSVAHLEENLASGDIALTSEDLAELG